MKKITEGKKKEKEREETTEKKNFGLFFFIYLLEKRIFVFFQNFHIPLSFDNLW